MYSHNLSKIRSISFDLCKVRATLVPDHALLFWTVKCISKLAFYKLRTSFYSQKNFIMLTRNHFFLFGTRLWYFDVLKVVILQGCFCCIFASLIFERNISETWQNVFLFHFSFSRKSHFNVLDIQISERQQMPKHKTSNTFYLITWEVNTVC